MQLRFSIRSQGLIFCFLLILSHHFPSMHAHNVHFLLSNDEADVFNESGPRMDPGSWSPVFEPDIDPDCVNGSYYAAVSEMMLAASEGDAKMMAEVVAEFEAAANDGDPSSQSVLAFLYGAGMMRERDEAKALMYHQFAAQGGNYQSKMALAYTYYRRGMHEESAKLYAEIAKTVAKVFLTTKDSQVVQTIQIHDGDEEDKELLMKFQREEDESFQMLENEAREGNVGAMYELGMVYLFGLRGLRRDHAKALSWLSEAADKGEPKSIYVLGVLYARGVYVERNYTKALELLMRASEHLCAAYNTMGSLYLNGHGVDRNYTKAVECFEMAADNGEAGGHYNLGLMYSKGIGVKRDEKLAIRYFINAANSGYDMGFYQLAESFHTGAGLKKNLPMAVALYKLLAERGPWSSLSRWGLDSYLRGDVGKAFLLYSRMAELGYEVAQSNAAWILDKYREQSMCIGESGPCTDEERHQLAHWLWRQAYQQGNEYAASRIADAYSADH